MNIQQRETGEMTSLRDILAVDRTLLAAEQTMLAYLRTSMCLIIAGATFLEMLNSPSSNFTGWLFIVSGVATFAFGAAHCKQERQRVRHLGVRHLGVRHLASTNIQNNFYQGRP